MVCCFTWLLCALSLSIVSIRSTDVHDRPMFAHDRWKQTEGTRHLLVVRIGVGAPPNSITQNSFIQDANLQTMSAAATPLTGKHVNVAMMTSGGTNERIDGTKE